MMKQLFDRGQKPPAVFKAGEPNPFVDQYQQGKIWAAQHKTEGRRIVISHGRVKLVGYYYSQGADRTVILVHGFGSGYLERLANAKLYYERGFNILTVICRGYGESGGRYRTLGYKDSEDVVCWANYLVRKENQRQIILDGVSMGGASVTAASGSPNLPEQVKGIVSDCSFTSIEEIIRFHLKKSMPLVPAFPVLAFAKGVSKYKYGISLNCRSPIEQVRYARMPILFIHGVDDLVVPYEMGRMLQKCCTSHSRLLSVKGAGHGEACLADPDGYCAAIGRFLEEIIK